MIAPCLERKIFAAQMYVSCPRKPLKPNLVPNFSKSSPPEREVAATVVHRLGNKDNSAFVNYPLVTADNLDERRVGFQYQEKAGLGRRHVSEFPGNVAYQSEAGL